MEGVRIKWGYMKEVNLCQEELWICYQVSPCGIGLCSVGGVAFITYVLGPLT